MPTTEQLVEEAIKAHFAKPLPKNQHDLAAKIIWEIFYGTDGLSFKKFQQRVKQLEQEFVDIPDGRFAYLFLQKIAGEAAEKHFDEKDENVNYLKVGIKQAKDWLAEDDTSIRVVTLMLYLYLGDTQKQLGQVEKTVKTCENGLKYAQNWPDNASVWEQVLKLYFVYSVTYFNIGQPNISLLTYKGFWSWVSLKDLNGFDNTLFNWNLYFKNLSSIFSYYPKNMLQSVLVVSIPLQKPC